MTSGDVTPLILALAGVAVALLEEEDAHEPRAADLTWYYPRFIFLLDDIPSENVRAMFRFNHQEIRRLVVALDVEATPWSRRLKPAGELAMCILLYRLAWPTRLRDATFTFGRSHCYISWIANDLAMRLAEEYLPLLTWRPALNNYYVLKRFAHAIRELGGVQRVWGFIDGTMQSFCRPAVGQQEAYSGHKAKHGYKWSAIVTPDGMISSLYGPYLGKSNDWAMLQQSGVQERLDTLMRGHRKLYLYGDAGYQLASGIWAPYQHPGGRRFLRKDLKALNKRLSSVRIAVEQAFGLTQNLWMCIAFEKNLRSGASPLGAYYMVAALLTNCYTCLRGNQSSMRFEVHPPKLEHYLRRGY